MLTWAKIVQGLVALVNAVMRRLERQEAKQEGVIEQRLANDEAELNLDKNVRAIDNAFDDNAERMRKLYGTAEPPEGSSKR